MAQKTVYYARVYNRRCVGSPMLDPSCWSQSDGCSMLSTTGFLGRKKVGGARRAPQHGGCLWGHQRQCDGLKLSATFQFRDPGASPGLVRCLGAKNTTDTITHSCVVGIRKDLLVRTSFISLMLPRRLSKLKLPRGSSVLSGFMVP